MTKSRCNCRSKISLDLNCPSCGPNSGKEKERQGCESGRENDNGLLDCLEWSRLTPLLVFITGSFLTMKFAAVAAEVG